MDSVSRVQCSLEEIHKASSEKGEHKRGEIQASRKAGDPSLAKISRDASSQDKTESSKSENDQRVQKTLRGKAEHRETAECSRCAGEQVSQKQDCISGDTPVRILFQRQRKLKKRCIPSKAPSKQTSDGEGQGHRDASVGPTFVGPTNTEEGIGFTRGDKNSQTVKTSHSTMAQKQVSVKLLIDTKANKVLFAEGGKDFVDFLFYILSLPVGAVVRLLNKGTMVGSLGNLYDSIENLSNDYIQQTFHKDSLLKPSLPPCNADSVGMVPLLSVAQAPILAKSFFGCSRINNSSYGSSRMNSSYEYHFYVTDDPKNFGPECQSKMSKKLNYVGSDVKDENLLSYAYDGYAKGVVTYMIMDDLVVKPMSTISGITLLNQFSITDVSSLQEKVVHLGLDEGVALLKASFESNTVLTDVFLAKKASELHSITLLARLKKRLCDEDPCKCKVRPMGGKLVLLFDRVDSKVVEEEPYYDFEKGINRFGNYIMSAEPPHQAKSPSSIEDSLNGFGNTQLELPLMAASCKEDEMLVKKTVVAKMAVKKSMSVKNRNHDTPNIVY
ncbi:hypothetical protein Ancab_015037 [Ancistrocladus abbreviatus]